MKVFHIITKFDMGGAERVAINIACSKNKNFEYHVFEVIKGNSKFTKGMIREMNDNGIIIHKSYIKSNKTAIVLFPFIFLFSYLKNKPDVIHSHTEIPDLSVYLFYQIIKKFNPKVRFIRTIHNTQLWNTWNKIGNKVEAFFKSQNCNVAISLGTKESYAIKYNQRGIPIIFNGVQEVIQFKFEQLVKEKKNVLFAGRFEFQKGIDELIQVIQNMEQNEQYHFHIVGSGNLEAKINDQLGGKKNVSVYPKIFNLTQYLASFDYLFMPSNFEGFPLMSVEASMNRLPVIINSCEGLVETLPSEWPLKVHDNSVQEFVAIFNKIVPQIDIDYWSEQAYRYAKQNFSLKSMQDKYEAIYFDETFSCEK